MQPFASPAAAAPPAVSPLERFAARPAALWLVAGLAFGLRCVGLDKGLWLDDASTLALVSHPPGHFWQALRAYDHPPAYFLLLRPLVRAGAGVAALRLLSVACGVATALVLQRAIGRRAPLAGLAAGIGVATLPPLLSISHELRPYSLLLLATALALAAAIRLHERPERRRARWALAGALALAVATHAVGVLLAVPLAIVVLGAEPTASRWRALIAAELPAAALVTLWWGAIATAAAKSVESWWVPPLTLDVAGRVLAGWVAPLGIVNESRAASIAGRALPALALVLAAVLVLSSSRRRFAAFGSGALSFLLLLAAISWFWLPVFLLRTTLPALVFAVAFGALGLGAMPPRARRLALGLFLFASAGFTTRWLAVEARRPIEPWREGLTELGVVDGDERPLAVYPSYVRSILRQAEPRVARRAQLSVPAADPPSRSTIARWLDASGASADPSPLRLVARVDLTSMPRQASFARTVRRLRSASSDRGFDALLVVSPDATIVPALEATRDEMTRALIALCGPPSEQRGDRRYVLLRFPARPTIAP